MLEAGQRFRRALKAWVAGQGALGGVVFALVYVGVALIPGGPAAVQKTIKAGEERARNA